MYFVNLCEKQSQIASNPYREIFINLSFPVIIDRSVQLVLFVCTRAVINVIGEAKAAYPKAWIKSTTGLA